MKEHEYLIHILDLVEKLGRELEPGQIWHWGFLRDRQTEDDEVKEQDRRFVRCGRIFADWYTDEYIEIRDEDHWHDHIGKIVEGTFPLTKLPEHVRELAKELYYDRAA